MLSVIQIWKYFVIYYLYTWTAFSLIYRKYLITSSVAAPSIRANQYPVRHCFPKCLLEHCHLNFDLNVVCQFCIISVSNNKTSYHLRVILINATSFLLYTDLWVGGKASRKMRTKSSSRKESLKNTLPSLNFFFHLCFVFFPWING